MENKINIIEKAFILLQKIVQTRFGSAVVGFVLASALAYFIVIEGQRLTIESYREEIKDKNKALKIANEREYVLREEIRKEVQEETRELINYSFSIIQKARNEVDIDKLQTKEDIMELEYKLGKKVNK